ncbi:hypothetical protein VP1G_09178 [Cytospora mali]|uniref:Zinc finger protein 830 n=1 Tax=Cytospora mali TaxID=578113 RepID=A0A194VDS7_CYTMA|nr:hypothetical protein VP1G_09178 [Valsa mali var. pyri (nom. inval.)]
MADARSLLRQQRAARRIDHPHATYSDSGKLTCAICREPIKSEALWESHTRGVGHRQKLLAYQKSRQPQKPQAQPPNDTTSTSNGNATASKPKGKETLSDEALLAQIISGGGGGSGTGQKRKHDEADSNDVEMEDAETEEDATRKKRNKTTIESNSGAVAGPTSNGKDHSPARKDAAGKRTTTPAITPPSLVRRISGTPSHGVELQIPSRPATPSASGTSAGSTPRATSMGKSPLIPHEAQTATKQTQKAAFATSTAKATTTDTRPTPTTTEATEGDEDADWAAFEAEVVNTTTEPRTSKTAQPTSAYASDAVISAAPLTAEQLAAKTAEEEHERRRAMADIEIADEKEEATRALETEFEEMEELEARVRKLKEKREALRKGSIPAATTAAAAEATADGNGDAGGDKKSEVELDEDEDDDDSDEDDDDWAGFRFRG